MAFRVGKSLTVGNTSVIDNEVRLHGNLIAKRKGDDIYVTLAGWNTPTTRERVNGIIYNFCGAYNPEKFVQRKYSLMIYSPYGPTRTINSNTWFKLEQGKLIPVDTQSMKDSY